MRFRAILAISGMFATGVVSAATSSPEALRSQIERELRLASRETSVPYDLLAAIAFIESRWTNAQPDGEHAPLYGVMGLRDDDWFGHSLVRAARLLGRPSETLKTEVSANIQGAAKLLRSLKGAVRSQSILEWKNAVLDYTGIPGTADRELYWQDLLKRLASGYAQNGIRIQANAALKVEETIVPPGQAIEWDPSPNFNEGQIHPKYVVIHTTQGSFASAVSWLKNPQSNVSAHYVIRASDGFIKNLVRESDKAWHVRCWNPVAIGIEHEGFVEDPLSYTDVMVKASAALTRRILGTHSIPADDMHVFGHNFWSTERYQAGHPDDLPACNDHTDPGLFWDWTKYFKLLTQI